MGYHIYVIYINVYLDVNGLKQVVEILVVRYMGVANSIIFLYEVNR